MCVSISQFGGLTFQQQQFQFEAMRVLLSHGHVMDRSGVVDLIVRWLMLLTSLPSLMVWWSCEAYYLLLKRPRATRHPKPTWECVKLKLSLIVTITRQENT